MGCSRKLAVIYEFSEHDSVQFKREVIATSGVYEGLLVVEIYRVCGSENSAGKFVSIVSA